MENTQARKQSSFLYALKCAAIVAVLAIITNLSLYFLHQLNNIYLGILNTIAFLILHFIFIRYYRDKLSGGYITFGKAFNICFQIIVYAAIVRGLYSMVFNQYIDPHAMELQMKQAEQDLVNKGMPDEEIESSMKMMKMLRSPMIVFGAGILGAFLYGSLVSLIMAAICKKESNIFLAEE